LTAVQCSEERTAVATDIETFLFGKGGALGVTAIKLSAVGSL